MKFSKRMICLFLTVMLLGAVLALPAYAAESDCIQGIAFVNASSLRMRSEPSLSGKILASAAKNEVVVLLAKEGDWYKVSVDGKTGYMMAKYLKVTGEAHNGSARVFNANGGSYVNFRSRASLSASVIRTVPVGTTVKVLEKTTDWTKVEVDGKTGYISTWFLKF